MALRPYQLEAIDGLRREFAAGRRRVLLVAPTGAGKTTIAAEMARLAIARGRRVLFLAHRRELVDQAADRLRAMGLQPGIIMAGRPPSDSPVQVASVQTLVRRTISAVELIIIDEAHHATASSYRRIVDACPKAYVVGMTATPFRADGAGLGDLFEAAVRAASLSTLISLGYLVQPRYWAPTIPDLQGVSRRGGDYDPDDAARVMASRRIVGDIVSCYSTIGRGARAVAFCANVPHSIALAAAFREAGVPAEHLDAETPHDERAAILRRLADGTTRVVTNVAILSEGYDCPHAEVVILARPTLSLGLHLQQIGRILRTAPGKTEARVLDHAGNTLRHGMVSDVEADLSTGLRHSRRQDAGQRLRRCRECYAILPASRRECPCCWSPLGPEAPQADTSRTLSEVVATTGRRREVSPDEYYRIQLALCRRKGWKPARAAILYKARYGRWP